MEGEAEAGVGPINATGKATEDRLGDLHGTVAEYLTLAIATGNAPPALIGAAIAFLKNNNITASAATNEKLANLSASLKSKQRGGTLTRKSFDEANAEFSAVLGNMGLPQ